MTMKKHFVSLALAATMATGASVATLAADAEAPAGEPALGDKEDPTSGPGVQGYPGTRTGPAAQPSGESASEGAEGASEGTSGTDSKHNTLPSQDAGGVKGFPDTRTGPAEHRAQDDEGADSDASQ